MEEHNDRGKMKEESAVSGDSTTEDDSSLAPTPPNRTEPGGWQSVKYILGNESFEKLASMGLIGNLTLYLQSKYNMDSILVVNVFNVWSGSSNLTPLIGAFLSDAYLGRFRTLLYGSIASFLVYLPIAKRNTNKDKRMTMRQRINTGIVMSFLCMIVASSVEKKRRSLALEHKSYISPLSIFALLPQFALSGLTEAFAAIAVMEFLTTHLPESMRTIAGAVFFLSLSVSSYLNAALVNLVHRITAGYGHRPWLGGRDLNQSRIDNFFTLIAALAVVNLLYFNFFSCRYLKPSAQKSSESVDVEDGLGKKQEEQA
ncbi:Protein NRT1/ PTR FAMILY 2.8 [Linum perenne]